MGFLSKAALLRAYKALSELTNDPSAQGATQATSALRYIFALDEFTKKYGRNCDTTNKDDREAFISFVGNVVSINSELYSANFFNAIKNNPDYAVGSNFFSVNVVKNSTVNPNTDFTFPKRGNNPLFIVKDGTLIEKPDLLVNLKEYLHTPELRNEIAVWLMRFEALDNSDIYNSLVEGLKKRYSENIVSALHLDEDIVRQIVGNTLIDNPYSLSISDFPSSAPKKKPEVELLPNEALINKVRDSFTHFVHLINTHTNDFTGYIAKFEEFVNPKISALYPEYTSIFQIVDIAVLHSIISKLKEADPSLEKVFSSEYNGTQYQAFRTMKYYEMYLDILADSDFRSNIDRNKSERLCVASATSSVADKSAYLRAMRTKPFLLLAGISGTGKSRIVKEMAFDSCPDIPELRKDPTSPGNYCLVEVKPNWHDSTELLGYVSRINGAEYVTTPFVKFLAKAMLYPDTPFFVCLDEMNLAPVEQYFAEFLSVLESRKKVGDHILSEPLIKPEIFANKDYELKLQDDLFGLEIKEEMTADGSQRIVSGHLPGNARAVYAELAQSGLRIPENVVVIGTVNMDETTHQFSRKVIDRAMTIEMNLPEGIKPDGSHINPFVEFYNSRELGYRAQPLDASLYLPTIVSASEALADLTEQDAGKTEWLKNEFAKVLTELNSALEDTPFKIAYRVQNELIIYFHEIWQEDKKAKWREILSEAVDQILMMKVLPRVEGDEDLLEKPLDRLAAFCAPYHNASKKIDEMKTRLNRAHFTSFWP